MDQHRRPDPTSIGQFNSRDGTLLYYEAHEAETPRAHLLFVHGFAEHCGRYRAFGHRCRQRGFTTSHFDYRGHGKAGGRRGHIFRFEEYLDDFRAFVTHAREQQEAKVPVFVFAHSYGGLITSSALTRHLPDIAGVVLSSPFFGFAIKLPKWKAFAGRLMSRYIPGLALPTDIDPRSVSHDPATIQEYAEDPLIGRVASARWLTETEAAHASLARSVSAFNAPVLLQQAGADQLVDGQVGRARFDQMSSADKTWQDYPDYFHELWFETDRDVPIEAALTWVEERL